VQNVDRSIGFSPPFRQDELFRINGQRYPPKSGGVTVWDQSSGTA
jgi:hypothetical protein